MTRADLEEFLCYLHNAVGNLPRYNLCIEGGRYSPPEASWERARNGEAMDSRDVDALEQKLRTEIEADIAIREAQEKEATNAMQ